MSESDLLNSGILEIYEIISGKTDGGKPTKTLKLKNKAWYGEANCSISEYYSAKQSDVEIEKRVEILQDRAISSKDVIIIDDIQYNIGRIYHGLNKDGRPITDITLEKVVTKYEFERI